MGGQAKSATWATPSARDWKDTPGMTTMGTNPDGTERDRNDQLPRQANQVLGIVWNGSSVEIRGLVWRPVEPEFGEVASGSAGHLVRGSDRSTFPMVRGAKARTLRIKGYGDGICVP